MFFAATQRESFPWESSPTREIVRLAWPVTLSGLSFAVMGVIDAAMVARLGEAELAGVGLGVVVTQGIMGFGFGAMRGVKILLAQARGAGLSEASSRAFIGAGVFLAAWLGLLMALIGQLSADFFAGFAASERAAESARLYITIRSLGAPLIVGYTALREARFGNGDTRSPLVVALIANVTHACCDFVALFVLHWGVEGAALANVIAFGTQTTLLAFVQHRNGGLHLNAAAFRAQTRVLSVGALTGLQWVLEIGSMAVLSVILAGTSDRDMAAHQIAAQMVVFSFLPALALSEAGTLLVAQTVGRGRFHLVPEVARSVITLSLSYALFCAAIFITCGGLIAQMFGAEPGLLHTARLVLIAAALHQIFDASTAVAHGILRGAGAQRRSLIVAVSCAWGVTPTFGFLFARRLGLGAPGGWLAMALEMIAASTLLWWHIAHLGWVGAARRAFRASRGVVRAAC